MSDAEDIPLQQHDGSHYMRAASGAPVAYSGTKTPLHRVVRYGRRWVDHQRALTSRLEVEMHLESKMH